MTAAWSQLAETITFHNPLAAASIFDQQICAYTKGMVEVGLDSEIAIEVQAKHFGFALAGSTEGCL
jgi:hypothetical protein